jgi:hypothetical protein
MNTGDDVVDELRDAIAPELLLLERLGSGGMGDVFLARDPVLKRNVAVKVLSARLGLSPQARQRFAREAEAAAAVAHPNVVPIHRVGTLPRSGLGYIVMAQVDGPTLKEFIPPGTAASESDARRIMAEIAGALAAAHARGVVHRDIKPANVLYDRPSGRFVVVDFGIASVLDRGDSTTGGVRITQAGYPVGTPEYMSPEQAAGDPVGEKSDIYSLGCLAYELLTGKPPFTGPSVGSVIRMQLQADPAPLRAQRSDLSPELATLVMRCLDKDPARRPDAEEVTRALGLVRRATIEWPPPGLESLHREGTAWLRTLARFALALLLFVLALGIHPAAARPCCVDAPDRSPGWLLLKRLSLVTPIHFDDPDALSIWYFLLDVAFFVALAALVPLVGHTIGLVRRAVAGRRNGYPLSVLGRVAFDRHRDTRDLLNLLGRYALVSAERQALQIKLRSLATWALGAGFGLLVAGCLAWAVGLIEIGHRSSSGLLTFGELLVVAGPAVLLILGYLVLEGFDLRRRRIGRGRVPGIQPLRRDVREAWLTAARIAAPAEGWSQALVRTVGLAAVVLAALSVVVASYALIAVFGASARFASERVTAREWVEGASRPDPHDSTVVLQPRTALALTATVPLSPTVERLLSGPLPLETRRLIVGSIGPAFCLNPREVLFGVAPERLAEQRRIATVVEGMESVVSGFDPVPLEDGGLAGLRRRARFCARYFGDRAQISPQSPRPTG